MRTLYLATGPELVHGVVTDLLKNDMTQVAAVIELAVGPEEVEDAPTTGWTLRNTAKMIGAYSVLASHLYTPTVEGFFFLWARWTIAPETVTIRVGKFRVM